MFVFFNNVMYVFSFLNLHHFFLTHTQDTMGDCTVVPHIDGIVSVVGSVHEHCVQFFPCTFKRQYVSSSSVSFILAASDTRPRVGMEGSH